MKRNLELIRCILATTAEADSYYSAQRLRESGYSDHEILYHLYLLVNEGLIDANDVGEYRQGGLKGTILGLTWRGQDYYEAMEDDRVWDKTISTIEKSVGSVSFGVLKQALEAVALSMITKAIK